MNCPKCDNIVPDDSRFCPECGTPIETAPAAATESNDEAFCAACGRTIPADSAFCPECGAPQPGRQPQPVPIQQGPANPRPRVVAPAPVAPALTPEEEAKSAKMRKILLGAIGGIVLLGIVIILCAELIKPSVKMDNYVVISASGYDTCGYAEVSFDYQEMAAKYGKKFNNVLGISEKKNTKSSKKNSDYSSFYEEGDEVEAEPQYDTTSVERFVRDCIEYELSATNDLNNGQVITLTWKFNEDIALEKYGVKIKGEGVTYTVEGLDDILLKDPFGDSEPTFGGMGPNGYIYWYPQLIEPFCWYYYVETETESGLSNGDSVKFNLVHSYYYESDSDAEKEMLRNYAGVKPSTYSKTFTVSGLDYYYTQASQIDDETLETLKSNATDVFYYNYSDNSTQEIKALDYIGYYFQSSSDYHYNYFTPVYRVVVRNDYTSGNDTYHALNEYYWCVSFYDLCGNDPAGFISYGGYDRIYDRVSYDSGLNSGWWSTYKWEYYGFDSVEPIYDNVIATRGEQYTIESNIDTSNVTAVKDTYNVENGIPEDEVNEDGTPLVFEPEAGILFPGSSKVKITEAQLHELETAQLDYAVYEIYARHGYIFDDADITAYYQNYDWYNPLFSSSDFSENMLNDMETYNVKIIRKEIAAR